MKVKKVCNIEGCEREVRSTGMCMKHYQKYRDKSHIIKSVCSIVDCDSASIAKGLCMKHYQQNRKGFVVQENEINKALEKKMFIIVCPQCKERKVKMIHTIYDEIKLKCENCNFEEQVY